MTIYSPISYIIQCFLENFGMMHQLFEVNCDLENENKVTVMILSFRTERPGQTVQTQIRLLLQEQSDQGLHCLPFRLHRLDSLLYGRAT